MFWERFIELCRIKGVAPTTAGVEMGFSKGTVAYWKRKYEADIDTMPDSTSLILMSEYFGVSVEFLIGFTDDPTDYDHYDTSDFDMPVWEDILNSYDGHMSLAVPAYLAFKHAQSEDAAGENEHDSAHPGKPRSTGGVWIPVLGKVAAGTPITAVEEIIDYEEIPTAMAKNGVYFGLQIAGDSMEPRMKKGDVVIVRKQDDVDSGQVAVVMVNGDEATVKRVMKQSDGILLVAFNPAYQPTFYSNKDIAEKPVTICGRVVELRAKF